MAASAPASAAGTADAPPTHFVVMVTGQIESGRYEGLDSLYCRYTFSTGDDWQVARGVEEGITQMSTAGGTATEIGGALAVWNFPVDVTFRATGVHGWPQIVLSVYGTDSFGRSDMIIGYGAAHLPMAPGRHEIYVRTFRPLASSLFARFQSWLLGARPEFRGARAQCFPYNLPPTKRSAPHSPRGARTLDARARRARHALPPLTCGSATMLAAVVCAQIRNSRPRARAATSRACRASAA